ncbi:MAG: hypothetical protein DME42_10590 [Verrucomicrobia bacterium]|nr:MAG: hypothetical protein DME42_10590 [Verrucomicrobiota bacterium]
MPRQPRILTLNLGSQAISVAEFRPQGLGGLVLQDYRRRDLAIENPGEPFRHAQFTAILREVLHEMGIKNARVNYAIAAQSVFARFVKLPAVEEEKIDRIIAFEAQQNVPFPIDEVVWDYQLVGGGADEQVQVVIVAIKSDLLEGNIGARTSNLLFIEPGKIFSRSVPIGGSSVTAALAREFNEPFAAAEARKREGGFVSLGGAYADPSDADVARMSKIIRSTMTRLHAEIMRSISHYRTQQQGKSPARIYLCGGSLGMPYMREFFQEKLNVPIDFFNPVRNVAIANEADRQQIARSAHLLGEVVGLALRAVASCPMELNLRPASVVRAHEVQRRRPFLIGAVACVIAALLGWSVFYLHAAGVLGETKRQVDAKVNTLRGLQTRIDGVRKEATTLDSLALPLVNAWRGRRRQPAGEQPCPNQWHRQLRPRTRSPDERKVAGPRLMGCLFGDCICGTRGSRKWWWIISRTW